MKRKHPHTVLRDACLQWLRLQGLQAWPNNTGAARIGGRWVRFGVKGLPDVLAILPEPRPGVLLGVECKTGKAAQTAEQRVVQANLTRAGAVYCVARDVRDLEQLQARGWRP